MREYQNIANLAATLCKANQDIQRLQNLMLKALPDVASDFIYPGEGKIVHKIGDAMIVKTCRKIINYDILWDQRAYNKCYHLFPVDTTVGGLMFLELETRRVFEKSHKIKCSEREEIFYVQDKSGEFWQYKRGEFARVKLKSLHRTKNGIVLPLLEGFNSKLFKTGKQSPHRLTLLQTVAFQQNNFQQLYDYESVGHGSLTEGLAVAISGTIKGLTTAGSSLIKSISQGLATWIKGVREAGANVIRETSVGIAGIIKALGGVANIVLYLIDVLIIGYLIFQRWQQMQAPPPVPKRMGRRD